MACTIRRVVTRRLCAPAANNTASRWDALTDACQPETQLVEATESACLQEKASGATWCGSCRARPLLTVQVVAGAGVQLGRLRDTGGDLSETLPAPVRARRRPASQQTVQLTWLLQVLSGRPVLAGDHAPTLPGAGSADTGRVRCRAGAVGTQATVVPVRTCAWPQRPHIRSVR